MTLAAAAPYVGAVASLANALSYGAAAMRWALEVKCATVKDENINSANRIKEEYGRGRSTEVSIPARAPLTQFPLTPPSRRTIAPA